MTIITNLEIVADLKTKEMKGKLTRTYLVLLET